MRGELFVLMLVVGLSLCGNNRNSKPDAWYPDGWDGFGFGKVDYVQYDEEKFREFWRKSGHWKRSDEKKDDDSDEHEYCYYPCDSDNEDCIRNFLSTNAPCVPMYKYKNKERINRERAVLYLPKFNLTVTMTDSLIEGLDGKVDKFYINKETGNLIFSVEFDRVNVDSKLSYFEFHRQGQEPIRAADFANTTYAHTVLTAVIPFTVLGLSIKQTRVTAYTDGLPTFEVGPKVTQHPDPVVQRTVAAYTEDVSTAVQEVFLTEAFNFFISYLQNYICDFGIKI